MLGRSLVYVVVGAVGGVAGTWLYWRNPSSPFRETAPLPFKFFALVCAAGWVWVPSMVIFSEELSLLTALMAMIGAFVLFSSLRWAAEFTCVPALAGSSSCRVDDGELFAESLYQPPIEMRGYAIALTLFAATAALVTHSVYSAAALLALSACLFAWERPVPQSDSGASISRREVHRAATRLARVAIPAVLVTAWALLDGVAHRMQPTPVDDRNSAATHSVQKPGSRTATYGFDGYESLILWPYPERRTVIAPIPMIRTLLAPGTTKPLIIRFDGPYWFVQPPDKRPGRMAHEAHGNPTIVNIQSSNTLPLVMAAHQHLTAAIPIARCREIEVEIKNRDNKAGAISLALLLTDATSSHSRTIYVGQQPILSTELGLFHFKPSPVTETLRFYVPENVKTRIFNELTVQMLPDVEHEFVAPKIAIVQFRIIPR